MKIGGLNLVQPQSTVGLSSKVKESSGTGFGDILKKSVNEVNSRMQESSSLTEGLLTGQHSNIHETMIAMEKSSLSFRMLTKTQTKVLDAYRELMRMQL